MARSTPEAINQPFSRPHQAERMCDFAGCPNAGEHRAPKSRERLSDYFWFCLDHVREYNAAWDYFHDMNEEQIEASRRRDTVWERPSWPFNGSYIQAEAELRERIRRGFGFFGFGGEKQAPARPPREHEKALAMFELSTAATFTEVKVRYKKLAKLLHPDANGGDREAEERLKEINQAYATLKKFFA